MAMNMNVMQPMNNSITNNFGAGGMGMSASGGNSMTAGGGGGGGGNGGMGTVSNQKSDPFAGLGF